MRMLNTTRKLDVKMSNSYMAALFINSQVCSALKLDSFAREILRKIANYMDMSSDNVCFAKQSTIAKALKMDRKTISRKTRWMHDIGILNVQKRGKLNHYRFGFVVSLYIKSRILSVTEENIKRSKLGAKLRDMGHSGTPYSNDHKHNNTNSKKYMWADQVLEEAMAPTKHPPADYVVKYAIEHGLQY